MSRWFLTLVAPVMLAGTSIFAPLAEAQDTPAQLRATARRMTLSEIEVLAKRASGGETKAQLLLGLVHEEIANEVHYWDPEEARVLYGSAVYWYKKAAEQGSAPAQHFHAVLVSPGSSFRVDCKEALDSLNRAIEQKYAPAMTFRGWLHMGTLCAEGSYPAAIAWFKRGTEGNDAAAFYELAELYEQGHGVAQDQQEATRLYLRAAELGNEGAQNKIGIRLAEGIGTKKDAIEAVKWFLRAAEQGDSYAQCNVALHYARGEGFPKDEAAALMWAIISTYTGEHCYPQDFLDEQYLTESRVSEARERAEAWLKERRRLPQY